MFCRRLLQVPQRGTEQLTQHNRENHAVRAHHSATMQANADRVYGDPPCRRASSTARCFQIERLHRNLPGPKNVYQMQPQAEAMHE